MSQAPWPRPLRTLRKWVFRGRCKCSHTYNSSHPTVTLAGVGFCIAPLEWMEEVSHPKFLLASSGNVDKDLVLETWSWRFCLGDLV